MCRCADNVKRFFDSTFSSGLCDVAPSGLTLAYYFLVGPPLCDLSNIAFISLLVANTVKLLSF